MKSNRTGGHGMGWQLLRALGLAFGLALAALAPARAQDNGSPPVDPPGRVARLADVTGQVWLYSPDGGEWVAASRNRPITTGDRLSTDNGARAELSVGSTTLRMDSGTELEVLQLDDDHLVVQLHNGSVATRLRTREAADEFELRTGEGSIRAVRPGRYRVDRTDEASHLTVYNGEARFESGGTVQTVYTDQRAEFWVDATRTAQYSIVDPVQDAFAAWNSGRDRDEDRTASTRYVSPEMTGVEDLDRYGRWEQNPDYGAVWVPGGVAAGWAPYSRGHWTFVRPWGWTWVDDAPWGFAPFHYGRWVQWRDRWCWSPGAYVARPVYAPALVAWVGGPSVSVSVSVGGGGPVGWFPLAPREVYVPAYRTSPRYVQNINITHVTNITNVQTIVNDPQGWTSRHDYRYRHMPGAVTVVPGDVLTHRRPVGPAADSMRSQPGTRAWLGQGGPSGPALAAPPVQGPPQLPRAGMPPFPGPHNLPAAAVGPLPPNANTAPNRGWPRAGGPDGPQRGDDGRPGWRGDGRFDPERAGGRADDDRPGWRRGDPSSPERGGQPWQDERKRILPVPVPGAVAQPGVPAAPPVARQPATPTVPPPPNRVATPAPQPALQPTSPAERGGRPGGWSGPPETGSGDPSRGGGWRMQQRTIEANRPAPQRIEPVAPPPAMPAHVPPPAMQRPMPMPMAPPVQPPQVQAPPPVQVRPAPSPGQGQQGRGLERQGQEERRGNGPVSPQMR